MNPLYSFLVAAALVASQSSSTPSTSVKPASALDEKCPLHEQHMKDKAKSTADERFEEMNARGNRAMGFDQGKTNHRFLTAPDGGSIEVTVKDRKDIVNLAAIRAHLREISTEFARGDFRAALETHGELPAGAADMQAAKNKITYLYEELPTGARVRIITQTPQALAAVHQFLSYQVTEHRTGDGKSQHTH
jgi:hypothetical protein